MASKSLTLREGIAPVRERLLTTLFLAGALHAIVILGITFSATADGGTGAPGLDVLLVSDELPDADRNDNATYLAQRTQNGAGNTKKPVAPRNRASAVPIPAQDGTVDGTSLGPKGSAAGSRNERVLTTLAWSADVRYMMDAGDSGTTRNAPALLTEQSSQQPGPQDEAGPAQLRGPEHDELWITPDTRESKLAPYLDAWRRKVERIGTLNYPTAARAPDVKASPVLEVAIDSSGKLTRAVIRHSSGYPELDQAALAILKLASPFDPFPPEVAKEYRVLRFAYEWQFVGGRVARGALSVPQDP
ncbi:MAG TPA: TonB family protein [Steroidobacteraceae bacterium]|nr:TonB family protein [Steroidobacteraceae bacterium]